MQPRNFTVKQAGVKELAAEKKNRFKKRNTSKGLFDSLFFSSCFFPGSVRLTVSKGFLFPGLDLIGWEQREGEMLSERSPWGWLGGVGGRVDDNSPRLKLSSGLLGRVEDLMRE